MSKPSFSALDGVDRGVSEGSSGRFEGHFLACRCSLQHHRITHFLLISPNFRGGGRKGEDISCLVVKSGKCYQRVGGESFLYCCICRKSHIHRELHGTIKENS